MSDEIPPLSCSNTGGNSWLIWATNYILFSVCLYVIVYKLTYLQNINKCIKKHICVLYKETNIRLIKGTQKCHLWPQSIEMATDFHRIHTKFYPQLLGTYPQCCGKLYPQLLKLIHSAVENSKLFPQFIHYLWKTILATEYVPLAQLSHEGNIKTACANFLTGTWRKH